MIMRSFSVDAARRANEAILAFDIGGTWFRTALVHADNRAELLDKRPAINIRNYNQSMEVLQRKLIDYIGERMRHVRDADFPRFSRVAVSIGAAVNMTTGRVVASAPLWGAASCDLDLAGILAGQFPEFSWFVVNDVTALAMRLVISGPPPGIRYAAALTVSSGIAYRTIDLQTGEIPADSDYGLQGEIGHLPVEAFWRGRRLEERCDCGALGHVSAFSSGRAIASLLASLPGLATPDGTTAGWAASHGTPGLAAAVASGEPTAIEFLEFVTRPVAYVLLYQMALNPDVQFTSVSGGVAEGLRQHYLDALLRNLDDLGLYGIPKHDTGYFRRRIGLGSLDGLDAIRGAAIFAWGNR